MATLASQTWCLMTAVCLLVHFASAQVRDFDQCTKSSQCISKLCLDDRCRPNQPPPLSPLGGACADRSECESSSHFCRNNVCVATSGTCDDSNNEECEPNEWCDGNVCRRKRASGSMCRFFDQCLSNDCKPSKTCPRCMYCNWRPNEPTTGRCVSDTDCGEGNRCLNKIINAGTYDYGMCGPCKKDGEMALTSAGDECCSRLAEVVSFRTWKCASEPTPSPSPTRPTRPAPVPSPNRPSPAPSPSPLPRHRGIPPGGDCDSGTDCWPGLYCRLNRCGRYIWCENDNPEKCEANEWCLGTWCMRKGPGGWPCDLSGALKGADRCLSGSCVPSQKCRSCGYCTWSAEESTAGRCTTHEECGEGMRCRDKVTRRGEFDYGVCKPCVEKGIPVFFQSVSECCSREQGGTSTNGPDVFCA